MAYAQKEPTQLGKRSNSIAFEREHGSRIERTRRNEVSEQAQGSGHEIDNRPRFEHYRGRRDPDAGRKKRTEGQRNQVRVVRVMSHVAYRGKPAQGKNLLPDPESRAAQSDLLEQIANEGLPGAAGVQPFEQPQR
jgi:hypothetical protein